MRHRCGPRRGGFTLIEVLVALVIVAVALLASLRAAGQGTNDARELRARLFAGWVAENLIAERRARGEWMPPGIERGQSRQGGQDFAWRMEVSATPNQSFRRVDVAVSPAQGETPVLFRLTGFVTRPPGDGR